MLWAFSIFHPEDCPVLLGILDFKSSNNSTDSWCSRSQPSAVKPKACYIYRYIACYIA